MSSISRVSLADGIEVCISSEAASGSSTVLGLDCEQQHLARVWLWADNFSHSKVLLLSSSSNKNKITVDCKATFYSAPNQLPIVFSSRCLMLPWKPLDLCEGMSLVLSWQLVWFVRATRSNLPKQQRNAESQSLMYRSEGWHVVSWFGFAELFRKGRSWMQTVNILMSGSTHRIKHCWAALSVSTCPVPYLHWLLLKTPVHWDCASPVWVLTHIIIFLKCSVFWIHTKIMFWNIFASNKIKKWKTQCSQIMNKSWAAGRIKSFSRNTQEGTQKHRGKSFA